LRVWGILEYSQLKLLTYLEMSSGRWAKTCFSRCSLGSWSEGAKSTEEEQVGCRRFYVPFNDRGTPIHASLRCHVTAARRPWNFREDYSVSRVLRDGTVYEPLEDLRFRTRE